VEVGGGRLLMGQPSWENGEERVDARGREGGGTLGTRLLGFMTMWYFYCVVTWCILCFSLALLCNIAGYYFVDLSYGWYLVMNDFYPYNGATTVIEG
jgi:hypothetical protein